MAKCRGIDPTAIIEPGVLLGRDVTVGYYAMIRSGAMIGDRVQIGAFNQIEGDCEIGADTRFHSNVHICKGTTVGERCFIAPGFVCTNTKYPLSKDLTLYWTLVGDDVKIGANVTLAPGICIGSGSLIGLGSIVMIDIPPMVFAAGNPCRVIKSVSDICAYQ